jgi:hypothetical protein
MHVERRVLAFGVEDRLAHLGRQGAVLLECRWRYHAGHAELVEARHLPVERALRGIGLGGAFGG